MNIPGPPRMKPDSNNRRNRDKYCRYHRDYGHDTNDCYNLKNLIEAMIRRGQLANYVRRENQERQGRNREDEALQDLH